MEISDEYRMTRTIAVAIVIVLVAIMAAASHCAILSAEVKTECIEQGNSPTDCNLMHVSG